jgi:hypothetical protein
VLSPLLNIGLITPDDIISKIRKIRGQHSWKNIIKIFNQGGTDNSQGIPNENNAENTPEFVQEETETNTPQTSVPDFKANNFIIKKLED